MIHKITEIKNIVFLLFLLSTTLFGQRKEISGKVIDALNAEELIGVNIVIKHSLQGVSSDFNGEFTLPLKKTSKKDTLEISYIGYQPQQFILKDIPKYFIVKLNQDNETLDEIVLRPDFSFEELMMDKIIKNRNKNNPNRVKNIKLKESILTSILLSNLKKEDKEAKKYKTSQEAFIKQNDSLYMLPIIQNKEEYVVNKENSKTTKTLEFEQQTSALENIDGFITSITDNKIAEPLNFYNNLVYIFDKSFPSPISSNYKLHYNMYATDSITISGENKLYKFEFYPKNALNPVFKGHFWMNNSNYSIDRISAKIPVGSNVNFINDYKVAYAYKTDKTNRPYLSDIETYATFSTSSEKNAKQFQIQKSISHTPITDGVIEISTILPKEIELQIEMESLVNASTIDIADKIIVLKENPYMKTVDRLASMTLTGYYKTNTVDLGPYFDFFYRNKIEGTRVNLPLRTGENLWKNGSIGGYLGYGFKDKSFKYGLNFMYRLPFKKRTELKFKFKDDYTDLARNPFLEFIQENPFSQGGGNILSIFQTSNLNPNLLREKSFSLDIVHEINPFTQIMVRPKYRFIKPNRLNPFLKNGNPISSIKNTAVLADFRFSKDLGFDQQFFSRTYYGGVKPVYHFISEVGKTQLSDGSNQYYAHVNASIKKFFYLETIRFQTYLDFGHIFGKTPYPLLFNPQSIQGFAGGRYVYNLLDNYSFSSSTYSNLHVNINGGGILFNKIPLLRKLKLREAASFKMFNGRLQNQRVLDAHPNEIIPFKEPYMEVGIGVSNIFKVLRFEYVYRLNSDKAYDQFSKKSAIKMRIEVSF
ncbi:MAG: DUF5686 family protein [Flavobacteriales bacterium]